MVNQKSAQITYLKRQGSTSFFFPSGHGEHGGHEKHQTVDLIHSIYDFIHYICDSKQSFCQMDDS